MAIEIAATGTGHPSRNDSRVKVPYLKDYFLDWAEAATEKGSALAAADVIETIYVPAGTLVLQAGLQVVDVATGESADVALDLGVTGVDADRWVDGFDLDAAAAGAYATLVGDAGSGAGDGPVIFFATADTIDVLIQAATTAPTGGSIRVWAVMVDASNTPAGPAGIAQVGS